jgi:hypothetical protein
MTAQSPSFGWEASTQHWALILQMELVNGERAISAIACANNFTVATGTTSTITTGGRSVTVSGSPWPIAVVAELMDGASVSNVVIAEGAFGTPGSWSH